MKKDQLDKYYLFSGQELLSRWANGDEKAGNALFNKYFHIATLWCMSEFRIRKEESQDLIHETICKILEMQKQNKLVIKGDFRNYFLKALKNNFYNDSTKAKRRFLKLKQYSQSELFNHHSKFEERDLEENLLKNLNEEQKICFDLEKKGYSYMEIAKIMRKNKDQVRGLLYRARQVLRKLISEN